MMNFAIILGELYRSGEWRVAAVGQGFADGIEALFAHHGPRPAAAPAGKLEDLPVVLEESGATFPPRTAGSLRMTHQEFDNLADGFSARYHSVDAYIHVYVYPQLPGTSLDQHFQQVSNDVLQVKKNAVAMPMRDLTINADGEPRTGRMHTHREAGAEPRGSRDRAARGTDLAVAVTLAAFPDCLSNSFSMWAGCGRRSRDRLQTRTSRRS